MDNHLTKSFNFADLLAVVSAAVPDRPAVICGAESLSYLELDQQSDRLAAFLSLRGVSGGDNVGLQLTNCPAFLVGFFASCKLGAVPFNVNYRYVGSELRYLYDDSDVAALMFNTSAGSPVLEAIARTDSLKCVIGVGAGTGDFNCHDYQQALMTDTAPGQPVTRTDNYLMMIYTGGTTGMPKGVMWPHKSLFFAALGAGGWYHPAGAVSVPEDLTSRVLEGPWLRTFPVAPLIHGAALWTALGSLLVGHTIILNAEESFVPETIWTLVEQHQVNIMAIVGDAMALPLINALEQNPERWQLPYLNHVGSGGAIFSPVLQQRLQTALPQIATSSSLGATETGTVGPGNRETTEGMMRYEGRPDLVVIVDDRLAQPGETGMIARRGYLPVGYYGNDQKTRETFFTLEGVNYAMGGDAARLEPDGSITVLGRGTTCINTGGEKVYPEEVEQILKGHAAVADALVVGIPHPRWTQQVAAVVALNADDAIDEAELRTYCSASLAGYKIPRHILFAETLQRSIAGKPDYKWAKSLLLQKT